MSKVDIIFQKHNSSTSTQKRASNPARSVGPYARIVLGVLREMWKKFEVHNSFNATLYIAYCRETWLFVNALTTKPNNLYVSNTSPCPSHEWTFFFCEIPDTVLLYCYSALFRDGFREIILAITYFRHTSRFLFNYFSPHNWQDARQLRFPCGIVLVINSA